MISMGDKAQRQQRIRELMSRNRVRNQEQLQELLAADSVIATQATLSRDLRELGVYKGSDGYVLPAIDPMRDDRALKTALQKSLRNADRGGTMVVLRTALAQARPLADELGRARLREVLGIVTSEDTVFIATRTAAEARILLRRLKHLAGL